MGWQGYDNEGCMSGDRERFAGLRKPSAPSYTVGELKQLAHEFIGNHDVDNYERRLLLSVFIAWLAKRERGEGGGE